MFASLTRAPHLLLEMSTGHFCGVAVSLQVFGMLPLMFATGVGANGNRTIGAGAVGGELIGTLALLFIVPALFVIFQGLQEKVKPITEFTPSDDPLIQQELEKIAEYTKQKEQGGEKV